MTKVQLAVLRNECVLPLGKCYKTALQIKFGLPLNGPSFVWIDITNECNLRCIMCPQSVGLKRKKMTMEMDAFVKIIDQVYRERPWVILLLSGEPLLHKNLFEMIEYAKSSGCRVIMHTNATLLTQEMSMRILKSSLDLIYFSFDGCTSEIYEKVRVGAKFEQVESQIETFLRLRHEMKLKTPMTTVEILYMKETKEYINDFIKYWRKKRVDRISVRPVHAWLGLVDDHGFRKMRNFGHRPCGQVFFSCAILVDGTVVPCCMDFEGRLPLGNILKQPFQEIWNGNLYNRLRSQHIRNAIPDNIICYDCSMAQCRSKKQLIVQWFLRQLFWNKARIGGRDGI
jgi:radical SAM protein with 4Fe4S-binding SPASM domain